MLVLNCKITKTLSNEYVYSTYA